MYALYLTALTFHIVSIFDTGGMGRERALAIFLPSALVGVGIQIVAGYVSDYIRLKFLLIIEVAGLALSMAGLMFIADNYTIMVIIIGNGIAQGVFGVISTVSWPRFFGTRHLGAISGYNMSWVVAGSAIGPVSFSLSYRWTDSYFSATLACFVVTLVLLLLSFRADNVNEVKSHD
jgi:MFS family permease